MSHNWRNLSIKNQAGIKEGENYQSEKVSAEARRADCLHGLYTAMKIDRGYIYIYIMKLCEKGGGSGRKRAVGERR